ncbi:hypothetical protein DFP72DRAFT_1152521 [Ephemerocybe angulata]|uniref:Uncharacterized protein n=1 Tax=Ephemerocybe angulata TaxID=980116 RepID=A0A8H6LXD6_9AGAR|nr:hypothetical protein DFP72DRAFT_1152521 [Tulosesus angulatus]
MAENFRRDLGKVVLDLLKQVAKGDTETLRIRAYLVAELSRVGILDGTAAVGEALGRVFMRSGRAPDVALGICEEIRRRSVGGTRDDFEWCTLGLSCIAKVKNHGRSFATIAGERRRLTFQSLRPTTPTAMQSPGIDANDLTIAWWGYIEILAVRMAGKALNKQGIPREYDTAGPVIDTIRSAVIFRHNNKPRPEAVKYSRTLAIALLRTIQLLDLPLPSSYRVQPEYTVKKGQHMNRHSLVRLWQKEWRRLRRGSNPVAVVMRIAKPRHSNPQTHHDPRSPAAESTNQKTAKIERGPETRRCFFHLYFKRFQATRSRITEGPTTAFRPAPAAIQEGRYAREHLIQSHQWTSFRSILERTHQPHRSDWNRLFARIRYISGQKIHAVVSVPGMHAQRGGRRIRIIRQVHGKVEEDKRITKNRHKYRAVSTPHPHLEYSIDSEKKGKRHSNRRLPPKERHTYPPRSPDREPKERHTTMYVESNVETPYSFDERLSRLWRRVQNNSFAGARGHNTAARPPSAKHRRRPETASRLQKINPTNKRSVRAYDEWLPPIPPIDSIQASSDFETIPLRTGARRRCSIDARGPATWRNGRIPVVRRKKAGVDEGTVLECSTYEEERRYTKCGREVSRRGRMNEEEVQDRWIDGPRRQGPEERTGSSVLTSTV